MYWFPSTSVSRHPSASLINTGVPPTPLNARTGDETPPGITFWALRNAAVELTVLRALLAIFASLETAGHLKAGGWRRQCHNSRDGWELSARVKNRGQGEGIPDRGRRGE